jgi:hypothetical protein
MLHLLLTFAPLALAAVIRPVSFDPKVNKAVDSILLIVQTKLHHVVNKAVTSVATHDDDWIEEFQKIKAKFEEDQLNAENEVEKSSDNTESLQKRFYGGYGYGGMYGMGGYGWPYYGYGGYGYGGYGWGGYGYGGYGWGGYGYPFDGYGWGGWYFKVRKDIKQTIEGKITKGFKSVALQIVNTEYEKFLNDQNDELHLDATEERLALAWEKYASYQQKNTAISSWISALERKLSKSSANEKTTKLDEILKSSIFNVTDVFTSDKMDIPLSELYYPSETADEIDYV